MSSNIFSNVGTTKSIIATSTMSTRAPIAMGYVIADLIFALECQIGLEVVRDAHENLVEHTAGLTGTHHVDDDRREDLGVFGAASPRATGLPRHPWRPD